MSDGDLSSMAVHTMTNKPWSINECIEHYARRGIGGISIWKETVEGEDLKQVRRHLVDSGLTGVSYVRGGFFTGRTPEERDNAVKQNLARLSECAALGLPMIVLVCGATPQQTPEENFEQILAGVSSILPSARDSGIKLAIEPLHPMYAGDRSAIACLDDAMAVCDAIRDPLVGIAVDTYHVWWERGLREKFQQMAAAQQLFAYHVCDFKPDMADLLQDRGIMGEGCIALREFDLWMRETNFLKNGGFREVEIFSKKWWAESQEAFLDEIVESYRVHYLEPSH